MPNPQQTTDFLLGEVKAKLDDIHDMVHRQEDRMDEAIKILHDKDKEQDAEITSLNHWRTRVKGMFAVVIAIAITAGGIAKAFIAGG